MNKKNEMLIAASGAIDNIFKPLNSDKVLILTDKYSLNIANAFKDSFLNYGCTMDSFVIGEEMRPLKEIPANLEKHLPGKTIVLNIIKAYSEEIPFRIKWIFKVKENKLIRMGHMPGITEEMMLNSVNVDFGNMKSNADLLIASLEDADQIHITTKEGTDIFLGVKNRIFIDDVGVKAGEMCNLPCGEIYSAPLETEVNGVVVFNASIGDIGLLKAALRVFISDGKITKFESDDHELVKRISELSNVDDDAKVIGELGIGLNPGARITGNMLEDEKSLGTAHIAFGNNADFPGGGKNNSKIHRDFLFYRPTIEAKYPNGLKKILIKNGEIVL
jgi:aminopeptidase